MTNRLAGDFASWKRYLGSGRLLWGAAAVALWCTGATSAAQDALRSTSTGQAGQGRQ